MADEEKTAVDNTSAQPETNSENNVEIVDPTAADSTNDDAAAVNGEANHDTDASDNEKEEEKQAEPEDSEIGQIIIKDSEVNALELDFQHCKLKKRA